MRTKASKASKGEDEGASKASKVRTKAASKASKARTKGGGLRSFEGEDEGFDGFEG